MPAGRSLGLDHRTGESAGTRCHPGHGLSGTRAGQPLCAQRSLPVLSCGCAVWEERVYEECKVKGR